MTTHTAPKFHMGTLTAGEARAVYAGNPVILLPMGSHEDQGPHAPMGDYLLAAKIAELAAERATARGVRTLVAPVLPFGGDDHFGPMPGGIALSPATLAAVLRDMFAALHRHGLTRLVVVNGHGGNVAPVAEVTREVFRRSGLVIPSLYLWRIAFGLLPGLMGPERARRAAGHGADPLTSLGLHLFPELMRPDLVPPAALPLREDPALGLPFTGLGTAAFEGAEVGMPQEYDAMLHDGVAAGDPTLATAATGAAVAEALVELCARFAAHVAGRVHRDGPPAAAGQTA